MNLANNILIRKINDAAGEAGTDVESDAVDMSNFDGCLFMTEIATANADNVVSLQQRESGGSWVDLEDAEVVADENGQVVFIDLYRPLEGQGEEIRVKVDRSGDDTAVGEIYAIRYNGRMKPEDNHVDDADGIKGTLVISPDESE